MRIHRPLLSLVLAAGLPLAALAAEKTQGQKNSSPLTVGDFAVMLAAGTGSGRAIEGKSAADALVKAGVPLGNPKATLNEEKLAEILAFYGVRVTTATPERAVSRGKAESALLLVTSALASAASTAGAGVAPADLNDCLSLSTHGACVNCCKDLGGTANSCAKQCFVINKGSPGEPLP